MTYIRRLKQGLAGGVYGLWAIREIVLFNLWTQLDCGFDYFPCLRPSCGVHFDYWNEVI